MNIQTTKIELLKMILNIESEELIQKITDLIQKKQPDFWDELNIREQDEIREGIEQPDQGKRMEFNAFLKKIS